MIMGTQNVNFASKFPQREGWFSVANFALLDESFGEKKLFQSPKFKGGKMPMPTCHDTIGWWELLPIFVIVNSTDYCLVEVLRCLPQLAVPATKMTHTKGYQTQCDTLQ